MRHGKRARALRPISVLAAFGVALSACGLPDGYRGGSGYYGSPSYYRSCSHYRSGDGHRSSPRTENWSQQRLQQHWLSQAQRPR